MIGEFFLDGKPFHVMWSDDEPTPVNLTIRIRPCPLKPPVQVTLQLIDTNAQRNVANYRVIEAAYLWDATGRTISGATE